LRTDLSLALSPGISNNDLLDSFGIDPYNGQHEQQYVSSVLVAAIKITLERAKKLTAFGSQL
jgi:hypothetical protein